MAFDPTLPSDHANADVAVLRAQFNELKALIDAQQAEIAALQTALSGTALNPNVGTFSISLSEPPLASQVQAILDFTNSLSTSLTRV